MGRGIVKFLNLGYLAACAVSIWAICTKPIISTTVNLDMTPEKLGEVLQPLFVNATGSESSSESSSESRAFITRDATEKSILDYVTVERIADSFRSDDPKKNGLHLSIPISVAAKYAFDLKNLNVINEVVVANIDTVLNQTCETLSTPLTTFVFSITKEFALDALETSINEQIKNAVGDESSPITPEEVEDIYNNVYEALSTNEGSIPLTDLTDVIINGKDGEGTSALSILNKFTRYNYEECNPQPTEEEFAANPGKYFLKDPGTNNYEVAETYDSTATYYTYKYVLCDPQPTEEKFTANPGKFYTLDPVTNEFVLAETYSSEAEYWRNDKPYTQEDLDRIDIETQMEEALKAVPGLVDNETKKADGLDEETFNATLKSEKYYISSDGKYVKAAYDEGSKQLFIETSEGYQQLESTPDDFEATLASTKYYIMVDGELQKATHYDPNVEYYTSEATIKDIDSALVALINQYLLQKDPNSSESGENEESRAIKRESTGPLTNTKSKEELNAALKEFAYKYIPLDKIASVNDAAGKYVPIALLAIVILVAFPWALLALVTLIRTLRRDKVWTKPWIVIVLAFPQLILGLVLTYGLKHGLPIAARFVEILQKVLDAGVSANISTLCLIPSFVYLGVLVYSFIYMFFAHGPKVQYKLRRRYRRDRYYY